jgi:uncharacterized protein YwgA
VFESGGYSEERFYTKSTDEKGHGEKLQVRVPQGVDSQVYAMVREIPQYRHINDIIRDALIHRLEYLQKRYSISDDTQRFLELERMEADSDRAKAEVEMMSSSVRRLDEALAIHYQAEDWQMFANELTRGEERVEWLREPYNAKANRVLQEWRARGKDQLRQLQSKHD